VTPGGRGAAAGPAIHATEAPGLSAVTRGEAGLVAALLQDDEVIILLLRPSPLFIPLGAAGGLALVALLSLGLALVAIRFPAWIPWTEAQAYALGGALAVARLLWQTLDWWGRVYVLTDRRVIRRMGVLHVAVFDAPLRSIQHTSVFRQLRERVFGLGTIGFATAGSDVFDAFWVMVKNPFAVHRTVVDAINRYGRVK
jgi:hypothetical protein